ncbi:SpoIIAA family protein [Roseivivax sp. CAU 1753]
MIEKMPGTTENRLELRFSGAISDDDYKTVLVPALEAAIQARDRVRLLVRLDSEFKDFTFGAMMQDAKMGLKHWNGFDRVAIVAEPGWMTTAMRAFSVLYPCPVMIFEPSQEDEARRWLSESLGAIHQTDLGGDVLHVQLLGKLDAAVYEEEERDIDAFIRTHDRFKLLLDLREFDGWQGMGALGQHLSLVRDHRKLIDRFAIIGDSAMAKAAETLAHSFVNAETRYFDADDFDAAKRWISKD